MLEIISGIGNHQAVGVLSVAIKSPREASTAATAGEQHDTRQPTQRNMSADWGRSNALDVLSGPGPRAQPRTQTTGWASAASP